MKKIAILLVLVLFGILSHDQIFAQKGDIASVVTHKWKVIWYSDDGVEKNMLEKKQQLVLRADGSGEMSMMGEKVGPVTWTVAEGKDRITFQDDPIAPGLCCQSQQVQKRQKHAFHWRITQRNDSQGLFRDAQWEIERRYWDEFPMICVSQNSSFFEMRR